MFLKQVISENPKLINSTINLHQQGKLQPDTYVIDFDQTIENARLILKAAQEQNIELYFMMKQLGRNPLLAKAFVDLGYKGAVVVDYREAEVMMNAKIPLGNVGHLVQTPKSLLRKIMEYGTEVMTVFTIEKVLEINCVAKQLGITQELLVKVYSHGDKQYPGQEGGININELSQFIKLVKELDNVAIVGATAFPAFMYSEETHLIEKTHNYETIMNAIEIMRDLGCDVKQINAPSTTSVATLALMSNTKITHGEPGHGLTGTTPAHAHQEMVEKPSVVYLSEVSHNFEGKSYAYGGGHYRRSHVKHALCIQEDNRHIVDVTPIDPENIDYYFQLNSPLPISSTIIMAFRFQIFVTRSKVAIVKGIHSNNVELLGIYDSLGKKELM